MDHLQKKPYYLYPLTLARVKCFCIWSQDTKKLHFFTPIIFLSLLFHLLTYTKYIVFLRILWPIDWCTCSMYTAHLILLSDIFWAAVGLYDVCSFDVFASYSSALHTSLARVQGFSLMIKTHNSAALKLNGMTEDIFIYRSKIFLYPVIRYKNAPFFYTHNFSVFFFSSSGIHQSQYLDGSEAIGITLLSLRLVEPFVFCNHHTTQKIYHRDHHHDNSHCYHNT